MREISPNARAQVQSPEIQEAIVVVLDIDHSSLDSPIRVVNNNQDIVWDGNTYEAASFKFKPPSQEEGELSRATLTMSNVDRRLVETVRSIDSPPTITANIIFVGTTVEQEAGPWIFDLSEVNYNAQTLSGSLSLNIKPKQTLSTVRVSFNNFPGLVKVQ